MSFHYSDQYTKQSWGNTKNSMNNQNTNNYNLREEDIISSIEPSIVIIL